MKYLFASVNTGYSLSKENIIVPDRGCPNKQKKLNSTVFHYLLRSLERSNGFIMSTQLNIKVN